MAGTSGNSFSGSYRVQECSRALWFRDASPEPEGLCDDAADESEPPELARGDVINAASLL